MYGLPVIKKETITFLITTAQEVIQQFYIYVTIIIILQEVYFQPWNDVNDVGKFETPEVKEGSMVVFPSFVEHIFALILLVNINELLVLI